MHDPPLRVARKLPDKLGHLKQGIPIKFILGPDHYLMIISDIYYFVKGLFFKLRKNTELQNPFCPWMYHFALEPMLEGDDDWLVKDADEDEL